MGQPVACAIGPDTGPDEEVRLAPSPNEIRADFRLLKVKGFPISTFLFSSQRCNLMFPNLVWLETGNMELTLRVWDSYLRNPNTHGRPSNWTRKREPTATSVLLVAEFSRVRKLERKREKSSPANLITNQPRYAHALRSVAVLNLP